VKRLVVKDSHRNTEQKLGIESGLDSLEKQFNSDKIKKQSQRILGFNRRHYENRGN
jgi:hypothetical protein